MKKATKSKREPEKLPEYDFRGGVRGKYVAEYAADTNIVILAPEVAAVFPDSVSVNEALRTLIKLAGKKSPAK